MDERRFRVLIVDDEPEIRRFLRASLKTHHHEVIEAETGAGAITAIRAAQPDLMILDLGLPDMDGIAVTRQIRTWNQLPIIILSVRNRESDKIDALNSGADDYVTKPFGVGELLARIRVVMRRVGNTGSLPIYRVRKLVLDLDRREVSVDGKLVDLTPTEFEILSFLIENAGRVVTQRQIIQKVWRTAYEDESRLLRVNISNLRRKIEPNVNHPTYILTELGVGYRLVDEE
ncbi:MAG: response regulator transcription factor [Anaerolineales bacterium]|nr:response regulator transcription factor [Anaerolineales bacterium]